PAAPRPLPRPHSARRGPTPLVRRRDRGIRAHTPVARRAGGGRLAVVEVVFTDAALGDLRRIGPDAAPKVLKKVLILFDEPAAGYPLGGDLTGYRKLVVGRDS